MIHLGPHQDPLWGQGIKNFKKSYFYYDDIIPSSWWDFCNGDGNIAIIVMGISLSQWWSIGPWNKFTQPIDHHRDDSYLQCRYFIQKCRQMLKVFLLALIEQVIIMYLQEENDSLSIMTDGYKSYFLYRHMGYMVTFKGLCFKNLKD